MSNTIGLIAGIALLSFPQISSIPATISSGSASLSMRFQEKSAEPSPQNRAAFNDEKQIKILVKQFVHAESENDADTLGNHESQRTRTEQTWSHHKYTKGRSC
jgi:hypothetical protein